MRILCYTNVESGGNSFYRVGGVMHYLQKQLEKELSIPIQITVRNYSYPTTWETIAGVDILMMLGPYTPIIADMCKIAKDIGIKIWLDYDDIILKVPVDNRTYDIYNIPENIKSIEDMLKMADVITCTTSPIAEDFKPYNKNIHIIPNAFNDFMFKPEPHKDMPNKIVLWRGSDTHQSNIIYCLDELNRAIEEYKKEWRFLFMGYRPWGVTYKSHVGFQPPLDLIHYYNKGREIHPGIAHILMYDNIFNRSRSKCGFIECTYFGAAVIAPNWEEWHIPGVLNYKDGKDYTDHLRSLINGEIDIKKQNKLAWEWIHKNALLSKVNKKRIEIIKSLLK